MKAALLLTLLAAGTMLGKEVDLLNGHLTIDLPDKAVPGQSAEWFWLGGVSDRTVFFVQAGAGRITFRAVEKNQYAGADFIERAKKELAEESLAGVEIRTVGDDIVYALPTDSAKPLDGEDCYGAAIVRSKDGLMQRITFHIPRALVSDVEAVRSVVGKAFESIKDGGWSPDLSAHTATFGGDCGLDIKLPLPEGYIFAKQLGCDFAVYRFHKVVPLGEEAGNRIIIAIGRNIANDYKDGTKEKRAGKIDGKDIVWHCRPALDDEPCYAGTLLDEHLGIHVLLRAPSQEKLDQLISIVEHLTIREEESAE